MKNLYNELKTISGVTVEWCRLPWKSFVTALYITTDDGASGWYSETPVNGINFIHFDWNKNEKPVNKISKIKVLRAILAQNKEMHTLLRDERLKRIYTQKYGWEYLGLYNKKYLLRKLNG